MPAPDIVYHLVETFNANAKHYRSTDYNETEVRRQFVDVLFEALEWDVSNRLRRFEVKHEARQAVIERGRQTPKHPDYAFLTHGSLRFFVETKAPHVNLKNDIKPAYQLRRYGWSAKLPVSVLTDFEEFLIYDCRVQPDEVDQPTVARVRYFSYEDYVEKWDDLAGLFSRDAVYEGALDALVGDKKLKGSAEVDEAFLREMEGWRELLARDIALYNPTLTQRELNMAVQLTIDRIVFLRIAEDRGIEPYGRLKGLSGGVKVYPTLVGLFKAADAKYNSGLFHFSDEKGREEPDAITPGLTLSDDTIQQIISRLYYPTSPYEFSVLPADILGQVYERFLGKVITLSSGGKAAVEEKPEVRKAGGVYYTPTYIVDYIVQQTVGALVAGKTPEQVSRLRILDPACGSGSFLLGAFDYLIRWHRDWYVKDGADKHARGKTPTLRKINETEGTTADYALTTAEKKRILLNNLYGVDLDQQAVEVTKLSLLLKVLEGETAQTAQPSLMVTERVLPDLSANIKWGNSLIGSDFYDGVQMHMFDDQEALYRVKAFDWRGKDGFAPIMVSGGFDAVIGNPPYGALLDQEAQTYLRKKFAVAEYQLDTYPLFIERAFNLLRSQMYCGFIIPSAWVASKFDKALRKLIASGTSIHNIVIAPKNVFADAVVETVVIIFSKGIKDANEYRIERWDIPEKLSYLQKQSSIGEDENFILPVYVNSDQYELIRKLRTQSSPLSKYAQAVWGVKIYQKGKGKPKQTGEETEQKSFHSDTKLKDSHYPLLGGKDIRRYEFEWRGGYVDYGEWLAEPRTPEWFKGERLLVREVTSEGIIQATLVTGDYVFSNSVDGIRIIDSSYSTKFILGLLNSKLISFYHLNTSANAFKGAFPKVLIKDLENLPIRTINFDDPADKARHDQMVALVTRMLDLHQQRAALPPDDKTRRAIIDGQIERTDAEIDALVYGLYGLTDAEIATVEGRSQG